MCNDPRCRLLERYLLSGSDRGMLLRNLKATKKHFQRRCPSAIVHRSPQTLQKFKQWTGTVAKHFHFLARFRQMRCQQDIFAQCNLLAAAEQIFGSSKWRMWRQ